MKCFLYLITLFLSGCILTRIPYDVPLNFNDRWVIILNDTSRCNYIEKIVPNRKIWREANRDRSENEISRLKAMAHRHNGNAIANIKIYNPFDPVGEADSYSCAKEVFEELVPVQKDKEYISKAVTILPENKDLPRIKGLK